MPSLVRDVNRLRVTLAGIALGVVVGFLFAVFFGPMSSCQSCAPILWSTTLVGAVAGAVVGLRAPLRLRRAALGGVIGAIVGALAWQALYAFGHGTDFGPAFMIGAPIGAVLGVLIGAVLPRQLGSRPHRQPPAV